VLCAWVRCLANFYGSMNNSLCWKQNRLRVEMIPLVKVFTKRSSMIFSNFRVCPKLKSSCPKEIIAMICPVKVFTRQSSRLFSNVRVCPKPMSPLPERNHHDDLSGEGVLQTKQQALFLCWGVPRNERALARKKT